MAVKLIDLQLIYGVAGAREKFEDLASQLVTGEQPRADKVRIVQGDGGIDVHVGELTDPFGIDVFQCKFFPQRLGDIQKGQIRESFKTCRDSTDFRTKRWTLCLPVDLSVDEKSWFEHWRSKQAASGIVIEDVWGATKLEGLLYQAKNRGLRESFFKEEHLTQIRETHGMVQNLVNRTEDDEQQAKRAAELSRQADYVKEFVDAHRDYYRPAVDQAAASCKPPEIPPSHWEVVIRPSWIPEQPRVDTLNACWSVVNNARVRSNGWEYPDIRMDRQNEADWVGATHTSGLYVESWRFSQSGVFVHAFPIWDDISMRGPKLDHWRWILPKGFVPERFLDLDYALRMFTHIFRFASKLAEAAFDPEDETIEVTIRLLGTRDRVLITWDDPRRLMECCRATASYLENTWNCTRAELLSAPDRLAIKAAVWFFERFNWDNVSCEGLARIQQARFAQH